MEISEAIMKRTKKLMKDKNMTFYRLCITSGILHGTLSSIRYGKTKNITVKTVMQLCKGLDVSLIEFLDDPIFNFENFDLD